MNDDETMTVEVRTPYGTRTIKDVQSLATTSADDGELWIYGPGKEFRAVYGSGRWLSAVKVED